MGLQVGIVNNKLRVLYNGTLIPQVRRQRFSQSVNQAMNDKIVAAVQIAIDGEDFTVSPEGEILFNGNPISLSATVQYNQGQESNFEIREEADWIGAVS